MAKDLIKERSWIKKLENFKDSGLTSTEWCEQHQEKIHVFKYWKLRLGGAISKPIDFEEIKTNPEKNEIKLIRKTLSIQLPSNIDEKTLKTLLQAIERC